MKPFGFGRYLDGLVVVLGRWLVEVGEVGGSWWTSKHNNGDVGLMNHES